MKENQTSITKHPQRPRLLAQPGASPVYSRSRGGLFQTGNITFLCIFNAAYMSKLLPKKKHHTAKPSCQLFTYFLIIISGKLTTLKTSLLILLVSCKLPRGSRYKCTFLPAISFQSVSIAPCCHGKNSATYRARGGPRGLFPAPSLHFPSRHKEKPSLKPRLFLSGLQRKSPNL